MGNRSVFNKEHARLREVAIASLSLLCTALLATGCGSESQADASTEPDAKAERKAPVKPPVPVAVTPVRIGVASSFHSATAVLEASSRAEIRARTTGVVRQLLAEEGDEAAAGEVLLRLEDDQLRLRVRQAELEVERTKSDFTRRKSMRDAGVVADEAFQTAKSDYDRAKGALDLARLELSYTKVTAPFGGRVVRRFLDLGAHVTPGTPLFEVMDVSPLLARIHVPANRMGFIAPGQEIDIELEASETRLQGVVTLVSPIVDASTGTVKVTAEIAEYGAATRPGDFVRVRIVTDRRNEALLVNSRAVVEEKGESVIYVAEGSTAIRRVVEVGFIDGDEAEIRTGLNRGDLVIDKGQRGLKDGDPVNVIDGAAAALFSKSRDLATTAG